MNVVARLFGRQAKIDSLETLHAFVSVRAAEICGNLVMKYAQKRLGKIHYNLAKTHIQYAQTLVDCQAQLHAQVVADVYYMLLKALKIARSDTLQQLAQEVHRQYITTTPKKYSAQEYLQPDIHFAKEHGEISELAHRTGKFLFTILPANSDLLPGNVKIFRGQVRLAYIAFLQEFGKRAQLDALREAILGEHVSG